MKKILIVVNPTLTGVEYHRQLIPHYYLNEQEGWEVAQINEIDSATDEFLKQFQIVQFSKFASWKGEHAAVLKRLRKLDVRSVVDVDDYWELPKSHMLFYAYKINHIPQQITETITNADMVTTTTEVLRDKVLPYNPNCQIIQNAIDPSQPQFEVKIRESDKLRFGWVGGATHLDDIRLLGPSLQLLNQSPKARNKYQLFLMGFNPEDKTGIYAEMERIFTKGLSINSDIYYRINGTNVFTYAQGYNLFDVALIPLKETPFNSCKSELKLIEAGFMKKAAIVSDVSPYSDLLTETNCFTVDSHRNYKEWFWNMDLLIKSPDHVATIAEELYETVKVKYHIATANAVRMDLYNNLINRGTAN